MISAPDPIEILDAPLEGRHLSAPTLRALSEEPCLLIFLRHFGCVFCRETVRLLRDLSAGSGPYPRVVFVHQGDREQGEAFFERFWPGASAIADPDHHLYDAFDVGRGSLREILGPRALAGGVRAMLGGNGVGKPVGDVWRMPGAFLLYEGAILWAPPFRHAGDLPDYERIPSLLGALRQAGRIPEPSASARVAPLR